MKSEERILEFLAEYLQKTDRILERMEKTDRNVEIISKTILDHSLKFSQISTEIKHLSEENNRLRTDQGIMIKELISLSKRVSKMEDKS